MWFIAEVAVAATLVVGDAGPYDTIRAAAMDAAPGDTIAIGPGVYAEQLALPVRLTLVGAGADATVLRNPSPGPLITSSSRLTVRDLTLDADGRGAAIEMDDGVVTTLEGVTVTGGDARFGGGVKVDGPLRVRDSRFEGNTGEYGGAIYGDEGVELQRTTFVANSASESGAAVMVYRGDVRVEDCDFVDNVGGYALDVRWSELATIDRSRFHDNDGGGAYLEGVTRAAHVRRSDFRGNEAANGAAVRVLDTNTAVRVRIVGNAFVENTADREGGAIHLDIWFDEYDVYYYPEGPSRVRVLGNTFAGGEAPSGGAHVWAFTDVELTLQNNIFAWARDTAVTLSVPPVDVDYNLWFANAGDLAGGSMGPGAVEANPQFVTWSDDRDPMNDDLRLDPGSPAIDAGVPHVSDDDGSRSDIGAL